MSKSAATTNGTATPISGAAGSTASSSTAVIGINLGNTYSSIACINQHGRADVIANEDGERQLATRIAFNGDQVYIGQQATPQLVRNAPNVIDRFVSLLGRSYKELSSSELARDSAQVLDKNGVPSFEVEIDGKKTVLSAHDASVRYIASLFATAKDFLSGVPIAGAVLSVPLSFTAAQSAGVRKAAQEAGLIVLETLAAPSAALVGYGITLPGPRGELPSNPEGDESGHQTTYAPGRALDRTIAVVDVGAETTTATIVAARAGLYALLSSSTSQVGGKGIDDALLQFFAKEFTKKTKVSIKETDTRSWAKLRIEAEKTKKALSASSGAQQCSVESLAEGLDFSGSINRVRLDMLSGKVYDEVIQTLKAALENAKLDASQVDEVILAGGTSRLPGLVERLSFIFPEEGGASITHGIDSSEVLARGSALQAQVIAAVPASSAERKHIESLPSAPPGEVSELKVRSTSKAFGLVLPAATEEAKKLASTDGKLFVTLLPQHTPLPARRSFLLPGPEAAPAALLSFHEGTAEVKVETLAPPAPDPEDEDDEPEEPEEVRTAIVKPDSKALAELAVTISKGKNVLVNVVANADGSVDIQAGEEGAEITAKISLPASK
ncbi:actin-like ATPase domain-containing protein [Ceraceosorus guamensis]|uniref:Actin-like ATPase domain-containing protein n=1 Tax=Ceraceosorus guamensis TaxID=1522189 RepID=A0A316W237_9BASI|nr:actin-like ATPase domain-containing protein [Ceraceosorus guamensis]PWN42621.1 actin-like ATPase domain-containing protein [Ceraceosorus guamensis]